MVARYITALSTLLALAQGKAIVTNLCDHDVYIWSVPEASGYAKNLAVHPSNNYEEVFRHGTVTNPGIAIKISSQSQGISKASDEIDFAYSLDKRHPGSVWINLSKVRGDAFDNKIGFHTCFGSYESTQVPTQRCSNTDEVTLTLCGTSRTGSDHNPAKKKGPPKPAYGEDLKHGNCTAGTIQESCGKPWKRGKKDDARRACAMVSKSLPGSQCDPEWIADHPDEVWAMACPVAELFGSMVTCTEFKRLLKDKYPDLFEHNHVLQARHSEWPYSQRCDFLLRLFGGNNCEDTVNKLKDEYQGKKIDVIAKAQAEHFYAYYSEFYSDLEDNFEEEWPKIDWSSEKDSDTDIDETLPGDSWVGHDKRRW